MTMKKIAQLKFSGEEEGLVLVDHHDQPVLTDLQVISRYRRITLPSILQENRLHYGSQTSLNHTVLDDHDGDDEDATSRTSNIPPVVYNPTPLRWYRLPEADLDGLDFPTDNDHIDLQVAAAAIPLILDDHDELDTTLRLSNYAPRNSKIPNVKKRVNNPPPDLGWFRADFFDGVEDDEVDTTLCLRPPATTNNPIKSRTQAKGKRKADADVNVVDQRKRRSKSNRNRDDEDQRPLLPIEQIPTLVNAIESRNGSTPIFLYRKKLVESDVRRDQNRLFVTRRERLMGFLSEEEAAAAEDSGRGLKVGGVDGGGNGYDNFGLRKWASVKMMIINSDWWRVVDANSAKKGDVVEIWGFRVDEKPYLAFNFRREDAGSSGTSSTDEGTSQVKFNYGFQVAKKRYLNFPNSIFVVLSV